MSVMKYVCFDIILHIFIFLLNLCCFIGTHYSHCLQWFLTNVKIQLIPLTLLHIVLRRNFKLSWNIMKLQKAQYLVLMMKSMNWYLLFLLAFIQLGYFSCLVRFLQSAFYLLLTDKFISYFVHRSIFLWWQCINNFF